MGILGNIRKTGNRFAVIIVILLLAIFLGGELARVGFHFFSNQDKVGTLFGEKISYIDYYKACQNAYLSFLSQGKEPTQEQQINLKDQAWHYLIEDKLYRKAVEQAGIAVGPQELVDLVQGEHIHPVILQNFKDSKTAAFDKQGLITYLNKLCKNQQEQERWCQFEAALALERAKNKLQHLIVQSCFITQLEKDQATERANLSCKVDYLHIPFSSVKDELITLTNQQLRNYMVAHKKRYTASSESRTIHYITFPIQLDEKDKSDFQEKLNALLVEFSTTTDPYTFAKAQTDGPLAHTSLSCTADTLPDAFTPIKHTLKEGMVVGPVLNDAFHTLYKLIKESQGHYEIAVIEKKPIVGDHTRSNHFKRVSHLVSQVKQLDDLKRLATDAHLTIHKETLAPSDHSIGVHSAARQVVRWLYNQATVGKVSPLFDLGDVYLLGVVVEQVKVGDLLPLDSVFSQVYQKVLHQEKAKLILNKLKQIEPTTLEGIAAAYGEGLTIQSLDELTLLKNDLRDFKGGEAFVGKCFGLGLHLISDPIVDDTGIFIAYVKSRDTKATQEKHNDRMLQLESFMQPYYLLKAMEEFAKATDERYRVE